MITLVSLDAVVAILRSQIIRGPGTMAHDGAIEDAIRAVWALAPAAPMPPAGATTADMISRLSGLCRSALPKDQPVISDAIAVLLETDALRRAMEEQVADATQVRTVLARDLSLAAREALAEAVRLFETAHRRVLDTQGRPDAPEAILARSQEAVARMVLFSAFRRLDAANAAAPAAVQEVLPP